jgi:K+-sensing histidine kinase KdpD
VSDELTPEEEALLMTRYGTAIVGPIAAITVAGALVSLRGSLGTTNVGLVMVLVVLVAAVIGGRLAGVLTAVAAALSFNYFHTQPFLSFSVAARQDVVTIAILLVVALAAAEVGHRAQLHHLELRRRRAADAVLDRAGAALAAGASPASVWPDIERLLLQLGCESVDLVTDRGGTYQAGEGQRSLLVPVRAGDVVGYVQAVVPGEAGDPLATEVRRAAAVLSTAGASDPR